MLIPTLLSILRIGVTTPDHPIRNSDTIRDILLKAMQGAIFHDARHLGTDSPNVAHQIETTRSPDPILRRPSADREEERVTRGAENDAGGA